MKVNEIRYERVTLEETKEKIAAAVDAVRGAKSGKDLAEIREKMVKPAMVDFYTAASLCNARYTQDTRDAFYKAEMDYYDEVGPLMQDAYLQFTNALLDSPYRKEAEAFINPLVFANYELARKAHSPEIIADELEESRLVKAYSELMSQMQFDWEGKKVPMPIIRGKMQADDRAVRRAAAEALGRGMAEHAAELDDLYDQLVRVRDRQAKKLGLRSYTALGYYRMGRIDYDREMVETFRDNVLADIVPAAKRIKEEVARALGWESVMLYDDAVYFGGGQPEPKLSAEGILEAGREMYRKMSPETGKFMDKMLAAGAFDVLSRDGKWGGGYCTEFTKYEQIFILANFNGSSGDVDVVTHEFGHGFAMDMQFQSGDWELQVGGMETAECHSMSMEFFCWKYMDLFFDDAEKYKLKHLLDSFTFIPYGCMVSSSSISYTTIRRLRPQNARKRGIGWRQNTAPISRRRAFPIWKRARAGSIRCTFTSRRSTISTTAWRRRSRSGFCSPPAKITTGRLKNTAHSAARAGRSASPNWSGKRAFPPRLKRARSRPSRTA